MAIPLRRFSRAITSNSSTTSWEFEPNQKIYVKKSKLVDYQTALAKFKDQISYQIPGVSIAQTYGTFCREFDTDFSDYYKSNSSWRR